jgi:hypothetical protein
VIAIAILLTPHLGHFIRSDNIEIGKSRPRVATRVGISISIRQVHSRTLFMASYFPRAHRAESRHDRSIASPIVSTIAEN